MEPSRKAPLRVLVLGGSSEASALAMALAGRPEIAATLSLAGRVREPLPQPLPTRVGGFGGIDGLVAHLSSEGIDVLVDATHPFAAGMSVNAREASARAGVPLFACGRGPWRRQPGDRWREVETMAAAAAALGPDPRRAFLTIGRLHLAAFAAAPRHFYLVRSIDPVGPDHGLVDAAFVTARGPFTVADEISIMRHHAIDCLVTKNSGGTASAAKIEAARQLGVEIVIVRQPEAAPRLDVAETLAAIDAMVRD